MVRPRSLVFTLCCDSWHLVLMCGFLHRWRRMPLLALPVCRDVPRLRHDGDTAEGNPGTRSRAPTQPNHPPSLPSTTHQSLGKMGETCPAHSVRIWSNGCGWGWRCGGSPEEDGTLLHNQAIMPTTTCRKTLVRSADGEMMIGGSLLQLIPPGLNLSAREI